MDSSTVKASFSEAVRLYVAELQAEDREHPSFGELEAYCGHNGLPARRSDEIAEHLAICRSCGALLRFGVLVGSKPQDRVPRAPVGFEEADLDRAWDALSRKLGGRSRGWQPLSESLAKGRPSLEEVFSLGRRIAEALADLHTSGGVVRDLRLETVQVDPETGHVSFLDLGIAAVPGSLEAGSNRHAQDFVVENLRGASPEQVAGEGLDQRSNLFSLGSLLYELTTGTAPFRGSTPLETAGRVVAHEVVPAAKVRNDVPPALDSLIQRLLHKDPQERPDHAAAVAAALGAMEYGATSSRSACTGTPDVEAEIEALYSHIDALTHARKAEHGPEREDEIAQAFARLRQLQKVEAARFRQEFEARLSMPVDAGRKILDRVQALKEKLEGLTASDPASR